MAFDAASLEFGEDIAVELPASGAERELVGEQVVEVRRPRPRNVVHPPTGGAEQMRLEAELLAAQTEVREVGAAMERAEAELVRAREDLDAERERSARGRSGSAKGSHASSAPRPTRSRPATPRWRRCASGRGGGARASQVESVPGAAREARTQAEEFLGRLTAMDGTLGDGG